VHIRGSSKKITQIENAISNMRRVADDIQNAAPFRATPVAFSLPTRGDIANIPLLMEIIELGMHSKRRLFQLP
jgi:hypothetical protein